MKKGMETHWRHQAFPPPPSGGRGQGAGGEAAATTYPPGVYQDTPHILRFPPRLSARYRSRDYAQGRGQVDPPPLGIPAPTGHRPAHRARPPRGEGTPAHGAPGPRRAPGGPQDSHRHARARLRPRRGAEARNRGRRLTQAATDCKCAGVPLLFDAIGGKQSGQGAACWRRILAASRWRAPTAPRIMRAPGMRPTPPSMCAVGMR